MRPAPEYFSSDYDTARSRFREAVSRVGWQLESHSLSPAATNESLTMDVAISPGDASLPTLMVSSGLHGVEGFFGSAVQLSVLERLSESNVPRSTVRYVFLHAMNPFGFARLRRVNESNVDLNRNFLTDGNYSGAPRRYADLNSLLNPNGPPSRFDLFDFRAMLAILRYGMPALRQAVAEGQYDFPQGLFFGGGGPSGLYECLEMNLERWIANSRQIVQFDLHTGLGEFARHKLLVDSSITQRQHLLLKDHFGADAVETPDSAAAAYQTRGGLGPWCVSRFSDRDYLFAVAEFGTYSPIKVLKGLRLENQVHHWCQPEDPAVANAKSQLKELFCPASLEWRTRVLEDGVNLIEIACGLLQSI